MRQLPIIIIVTFVTTLSLTSAYAAQPKYKPGEKYKQLDVHYSKNEGFIWSGYLKKTGDLDALVAFIESKLNEWQGVNKIHYVEIANERYLAIIMIGIKKGRNMEFMTKLQPEYERLGKSLPEIYKYGLYEIDVENNELKMLYDFSEDQKQLSESLLIDAASLYRYGCDPYSQHAMSQADINLDGNPEVFLMVSVHTSVETGVYENIELRVFGGKRLDESMRVVISEHNSGELGESYRGKYHTRSFYPAVVQPSAEVKDEPGYRSFAKVFFSDFYEDDLLDVLVWRKRLESAKKTSAKREVPTEEYQHFKEVSENGLFKETPITEEQAKVLIKAHNFIWADGYPNTEVCEERESNTMLTNNGK